MAALFPPIPQATDAPVTLLSWSCFDAATDKWEAVPQKASPSRCDNHGDVRGNGLSLVTWNIDAFASQHAGRMAGLLSRMANIGPDIIFFQEVSKIGKQTLLDDARVRSHYYIGSCDWLVPDSKDPFDNITLVSRQRFPSTDALGAIWRLDFPSRYGRYAMCCDVGVSGKAGESDTAPGSLRLVNVHLDSLAMRPSLRPRQLAIVADLLRGGEDEQDALVGGLVAGDFNPVIPEEDDGLVAANGLIDCWVQLRPDERGFTWNLEKMGPYPPNRLDKVAIVAAREGEGQQLKPKTIDVLRPGSVKRPDRNESEPVPWSDHCGLFATFILGE